VTRYDYTPGMTARATQLKAREATSGRPVVEVHGYALRVIREARGRKVADLAAALGVDRSYIAHLENGSKRRVSPEFYSALLAELVVDDYRALLAVAPEREAIAAGVPA
jgi:DNA-binding XRE family transcriptional regulator